MYKEYLAEFWYSAKALENSKVLANETLRKSLLPPRRSLANGINIDYANIFWEDIIIKLKKKQREKVVPYIRFLSLLIMHKMKEGYEDDEVTLYSTQVFSVNNWALKPNQLEDPLFIDHMLAICAADKLVVFKAPKISSKAKSVSQGVKLGAQTGHKKPLTSSNQPSMSNKEATKGGSSKAPAGSKTGHSKKRKNLDRPWTQTQASLWFLHVDTGMHKEDQQATGSLTSLGVTSEAKANPQLSSAASTAEADPRNSAPSDFVPQQQGMNEGTKNTSYDHLFTEETFSTIKLEDLAKLVLHVKLSFKDLDSPEDDPVIVVNDSDEDKDNKVYATKNVETEDTSVPKSSSPSISLPTKLKDLPSRFNNLTKEVKGLKNQVHNLEIKLPGELKEIPPKLEDFTKTITSLTSQAKMKTLDALPSLLNKVTNALNQFSQYITSKKTRGDNVPSAGQARTQPAEGEKNTNQATISHIFQRRAEKENLNKQQQPKPTTPIITTTITQMQSPFPQSLPNASSQTKGKHIKKHKGKKALSSKEAMKESTESDSDDDETHLSESMVEYARIKKVKKFDFVIEDGKHIHLTEEQINQQKKIGKEAKAEAAKRKSEDPLKILNDIPKKKRKHADDIHDYFKANKRLKSSVQYKDHLPGIELNEPVLEISFKLHQGLRLDDYARTFSSLLLAEYDKRNLNPLKHIRVIEKLSDTETEEGPWLELQFSLVDNFKLNIVYLLNRS
nr:hypothetical protein [Tanacetum cinerariifolium]